jgi:long-chain acyl-CoA synthetase
VVGVPSGKWGETPVGYVALKAGANVGAESIREWANAQLGKTQRLSDLVILDTIPRSHIGKVMKKELRAEYRGPAND